MLDLIILHKIELTNIRIRKSFITSMFTHKEFDLTTGASSKYRHSANIHDSAEIHRNNTVGMEYHTNRKKKKLKLNNALYTPDSKNHLGQIWSRPIGRSGPDLRNGLGPVSFGTTGQYRHGSVFPDLDQNWARTGPAPDQMRIPLW